MKRKTHEEFISELFEVNPNIKILNKYINRRTKIKCRCLIDHYEWDADPMSLLKGHGCPKCGGVAKKTTEEFVNELHLINANITVIDEYVNSHKKIEVKCNIDGYIWHTFPYSLLQGKGCPKCAGVYSMSNEEFIEYMKQLNCNVKILGEYINANTRIKVKCKVDDYEWNPYAKQLLRGDSCPKCKAIKQSVRQQKSHDTFIQEIKNVNPSIEVIGTYINSRTKILVKCKIDNYEWMATPNNLLRGHGCPECAKYTESTQSYGEKAISDYLLNNNILFEREKEFDNLVGLKGGNLRYDFYLPQYNMLIEFDGIQHFQPLDYFGGINTYKVLKCHDKLKDNYANKHNYKLKRIPYWEINNINNILKEEIKNDEAIFDLNDREV